jgi:hypothetical protein
MPRSPTSATCDSLKRRLILSICSRIVCGSLVLPSNTSTATGVPSGAHVNPYTIGRADDPSAQPRAPERQQPFAVVAHVQYGWYPGLAGDGKGLGIKSPQRQRQQLDGDDLRALPLGARKAKLARLLAREQAGIVFNEHTDEDGATVFRHACKLGFEGIVSKRLTSAHGSGPSRDWIKVKNPDSPAMLPFHEGRWEK